MATLKSALFANIDSTNQLIRENNSVANKTWTWTYDNAGNILSRTEYAYSTGELGDPVDTVTYSYDDEWGDLLIGYDGNTITSDTIGNMLSDGTWTYTWEHGRQLASMTDGTTTWNYEYDSNGMRTKRSRGSIALCTYVYNGSQLTKMTYGNHTMYFTYDATGTPMSVTYDDAVYYYLTNIQGDVIAILDSNRNPMVWYDYDAWGNIISVEGQMATTLGAYNPLRYRGYVYDTETKLYYLQSRYYNPKLGRFLNADAYVATGQGLIGNNMFTYCGNNPVNYMDDTGTMMKSTFSYKADFEGGGVKEKVAPVNSTPLYPDTYAGMVGQQAGKLLAETIAAEIPTLEEHYSRNDNNIDFPEKFDAEFFKDWDDGVPANCHQFSAPGKDNRKYVSADGRYEVIYDVNNNLVTDARDVGTYNFASPDDWIGHFLKDIWPWIWYGNSPEDDTTWYARAFSLFGL